MKILKFGGSVLNSAENIKNAKKIIENENNNAVIVISAFGNTTDILLSLAENALYQNNKLKEKLNSWKNFIEEIILELFEKESLIIIQKKINEYFAEIENSLNNIFQNQELTNRLKDKIASYGELLSAYIVNEFIGKSDLLDAREIIKTDTNYCRANVDFEKTNKLIESKIKFKSKFITVPGFIGSNEENETTTIGRGGSDYTASIIAAALKADVVEIWTNVDGFMTADPKIVDKAFAVKNLSYAEAMELSHFGAKVIYTPTIQPVYQNNIKVIIRNAFNPETKGTLISGSTSDEKCPIKGVSSIDNIVLVTLHGPGMVGVKGTSGRLFSSLAKNDVNVILITQASSEYSISFAIDPTDRDKAINALQEEFKNEISEKNKITINVKDDLSIVAIVGEGMLNTPGISGNLFRSLGRNGINVIAIAQGSSELNISVVIKNAELKKALNVIHEGFFLSRYKEIHLFLVGTGTVGGALIKQLHQQQEALLRKQNLKINVIGIADIDKMYINESGIDLKNWQDDLKANGTNVNLKRYSENIRKLNLRNSIFVDCTASKEVAECYFNLLNSYVSVVAANKIACSSEYNNYKKLKETAVIRNVKFMYETNVGAGLPIINTINNLINSGDKILKIDAVLSGTLNFIFNEISEKISLSKAIQMAKEKGFSEPDPRIDLSGIDVVRKILILSREAGYKLEQKDVKINSFLPDDCFEGSIDNFWNNVLKYDAEFENKRKVLEENNKKWRFVASLNEGKASVGLQEVDSTHPSYPLVGSNNIVLLTTERYKEQPLIIRGYGAGADVTAAGVFGDIMQVANI